MRDPVIDVFRGLAITLVILGHVTGLTETVFKYVYSFHIPAFFIMSGFLFNLREAGRNPAAALERKFYRLAVPAWIMGLLCGVPFLLLLALGKWGITPDVFLDKLIGTLTGYPSVAQTFLCTPLWFLFGLFFVEAIAIVAARVTPRFAAPLLVSIGLAGMLLGNHYRIVLPFDFHTAVSASFFFAVGMFLRRHPAPVAGNALATVPAAVLWVVLTALSADTINMAENFIGSGIWLPLNLVSALAGSYLLLRIARLVAASARPAVAFLAFLGSNTLPIVGFNYWVNTLAVELLGGRGATWPVLFLADFVLLVALVWVVSKRLGSWGRFIHGTWLPTQQGQLSRP